MKPRIIKSGGRWGVLLGRSAQHAFLSDYWNSEAKYWCKTQNRKEGNL